MGPEVIALAIGGLVGWPFMAASILLVVPRKTRSYALAVLAAGIISIAFGINSNWGVPWHVWSPLAFAIAALPTALIAALIALGLWVFRKDQVPAASSQ